MLPAVPEATVGPHLGCAGPTAIVSESCLTTANRFVKQAACPYFLAGVRWLTIGEWSGSTAASAR